MPVSEIDRGYRIGGPLAQEYGIGREQLRDDRYLAATVDTIALYCGDDPALGNHSIGDAPEDMLGEVSSAEMKRHKAVNRLSVVGVFSQTDTST